MYRSSPSRESTKPGEKLNTETAVALQGDGRFTMVRQMMGSRLRLGLVLLSDRDLARLQLSPLGNAERQHAILALG